MYKYIQGYADTIAKYPILDYYAIKGSTEEEIQSLLLEYKADYLPDAMKELMLFRGIDNSFQHFITPHSAENISLDGYNFWLGIINCYFKSTTTAFIMDEYLTASLDFILIEEGNPNPPVYRYSEGEGCSKIAENVSDYYTSFWVAGYKIFQERLAGRVELQARVEQAKSILKPLYETASTLISPHIADDNMDLALHWVKCLHKEIFYNPYQLRYHSDYSKWESEALKYNNLVRKYLLLIQPDFQKINPIQAPVLENLLIGFANFEQTIRWVAAASDATVKKPSPAAQDAAKEERDITDFLL